MRVYLDLFILLNLLMQYLLLMVTAKIGGLPLRRWRIFLAAAVGTIFSLLHLIFPISPFIVFPASALLCLISFGATRRILHNFVLFIAVSFALCGGVLAIGRASGVGVGKGASPAVFMIAFLCAYAFLRIGFRKKGMRREQKTVSCTLHTDHGEITVRALIDSGMNIFDSENGISLLFIGSNTFEKISGIADTLEVKTVGGIQKIRTKRIPFAKINEKQYKNFLVGESKAAIMAAEDCEALIGVSI